MKIQQNLNKTKIKRIKNIFLFGIKNWGTVLNTLLTNLHST